jgi:hypothetical protein
MEIGKKNEPKSDAKTTLSATQIDPRPRNRDGDIANHPTDNPYIFTNGSLSNVPASACATNSTQIRVSFRRLLGLS